MALFAYIDLVTGGLLLQLLALGFASIAVFFSHVKAFVLSLFGIKKTITIDLGSEESSTIPINELNNEEKKAA